MMKLMIRQRMGNMYIRLMAMVVMISGVCQLGSMDTALAQDQPGKTPQAIPADLPKMLVWYDAADASTITESNGAVSQWADKSGNGHHATQETAGLQPTTGSAKIGGLNALRFDKDMLSVPVAARLPDAYTTFIVATSGFSSGDNPLWCEQDTAANGYRKNYHAISDQHRFINGALFAPITGLDILSCRQTAPNFREIFVNGLKGRSSLEREGNKDKIRTYIRVSEEGQSSSEVFSGRKGTKMTSVLLGGRLNEEGDPDYCTSDIAEVIVFSSALSESDREKVEGYLARKWGLTDKQAAVLEAAKAKTWEAIILPRGNEKYWDPKSCGFYGWKFGEEGHFRADQIVHVAENLLLAQNSDGGWGKNTDFSIKEFRVREKSTFDNETTYTQIMYLARVRRETGFTRYDAAMLKGIQYVLKSQNPVSGGWHGADVDAVTYNDDVMAQVMNFLLEVDTDGTLYGWIVEKDLREKVKTAYKKGMACILASQVRQGTTLTAWPQQCTHYTLKPSSAREFEPACIASAESVGVVRHLMRIENPSEDVIRSIEAAVTWLDARKMYGYVYVQGPNPNPKGWPKTVRALVRYNKEHPNPRITAPGNSYVGPPLWARMYDPNNNNVITRGWKGYEWYGDWPKTLLAEDYPKWRKKWTPDRNVLERK